MTFLRSERYAAVLLLAAALLGLVVANSPVGSQVAEVVHSRFSLPGTPIDLSLAHWVTDGLLAIFFFIAAIELRHELTHGELNTVRKALVPTVAAVGGVVVPALIFLFVVRDPQLQDGWPIPTATDIAFALGVLALVGRALPGRVRALLLALAVIDDLIAIAIIAVFYTTDLRLVPLLLAVPVVLLFGLISRRARARTPLLILMLLPLGLAAWTLVFLSGVHATIAGVALGLFMSSKRAGHTKQAIDPWSNGLVLPVFAFVASLVRIPQVGPAELSPVFWAIVIALPVGKLIGITAGTLLATNLSPRRSRQPIPLGDTLVVASIGGVGFTVSLLMNELSHAGQPELAVEGTLGVLLGSLISAVFGSVVAILRSRHYVRRTVGSQRDQA